MQAYNKQSFTIRQVLLNCSTLYTSYHIIHTCQLLLVFNLMCTFLAARSFSSYKVHCGSRMKTMFTEMRPVNLASFLQFLWYFCIFWEGYTMESTASVSGCKWWKLAGIFVNHMKQKMPLKDMTYPRLAKNEIGTFVHATLKKCFRLLNNSVLTFPQQQSN